VKSDVDATSCTVYVETNYFIRSDDTIRPNTNTLFGPLFGTEANTKRTSLLSTQIGYIRLLKSMLQFKI